MANEPEIVRTSAQIAEHAGTNAVVVRRVLGKLREAGLLTSEKGHAGGWQLSRSPQTITIADVYLALDERLVAAPEGSADLHCSIEHSLQQQVAEVLEDAERGLVIRFKALTIAEITTQSE